ncbi:PDR/VanB family oxidoreductase [Amycolatopsis sp. YIM 10]|uniref:PDR/VanB family oxidoreductase n=1 Tax=Amycolatopsis sp. YIM 10 TaxID=2653857 RepID=UPI00128FE9AD|nr:PDR/VanB family oxidoreductase [Amycolatopsis sp. YIM 10]QFU91218.1 Phthalate dioxygenase reductase [Amycolatopsis sp. YIM 10]
MTAFTPSRTLRLIAAVGSGYRRVFATSRVAPLLSRPNPVRHTGFDLDLAIERVVREADDVVSLTLADPSGADLPSWIPGAHLDLFLPSGRQRQYSLCGDPADRRTYRIAVRRIGEGSREIHELEQGKVRVRGPRNAFPLVDADSYLFVAGGIGITPILPMVRSCRRRGAPWRLVYLGRSRESMPFLDELGALGDVDIRPDDEFGLPDIITILPLAEPGAAVYLCGPPALGEGARGLLREINPAASLHTERFSPLPVTGGEPFDVRLARSGATVRVGADESALAAIRRELPGVAYSCQQGFCGTCKVRVLGGEVDHRDRTLTEGERDGSMLVCVSRSTSPSLVIDL